jgi:DNA invertase Pin-like site-specific DNA recombinase
LLRNAAVLLARSWIASRDVDFLRRCVADAGDSGILFSDLLDLPPGAAGRLMLTVIGSIAEFEAGRISERTRAALQAAKSRRRKHGNPNLNPGDAAAASAARAARVAKTHENAARTLPLIAGARAADCRTPAEIADAMMARGISAPSGREHWHPSTVPAVQRTSNRPAEQAAPLAQAA